MIKAKKSLGQNFLIDENIIQKIISSGVIQDKNVLEIGPGTRNLTRAILSKKPKKFYVIEKDHNLSELLMQNFKNQITIINEDVLKFNEKNITNEKLVVFGNLPYNISTEILCKWIINLDSDQFWFDELILMFQKEVAERIIAKINTSNYGRLTILTNWKLEVKIFVILALIVFFPNQKLIVLCYTLFQKKIFLGLKTQKI